MQQEEQCPASCAVPQGAETAVCTSLPAALRLSKLLLEGHSMLQRGRQAARQAGLLLRGAVGVQLILAANNGTGWMQHGAAGPLTWQLGSTG